MRTEHNQSVGLLFPPLPPDAPMPHKYDGLSRVWGTDLPKRVGGFPTGNNDQSIDLTNNQK